MTELITGITAQPNFPREDLTPENADMLELLVSSVQMIQQTTSSSLLAISQLEATTNKTS